jgi:hypothetical protein
LEICYPSCRYVDSTEPGNVYVEFTSEVTIVDEDGNEDDKDRAAAVYGGRDTDITDLRLLIDVAKWRAQPAEYNLILLVHEATHIDTLNHGNRFWTDFIENVEQLLEEDLSSEFLPEYDRRELIIAAIHHVSPYSCDGDWSYYDRREWVADQLPYPEDDYEQFERLVHEADENVEFPESRKFYNAVIDSDGSDHYVAFQPDRGNKWANMTLAPEYIEKQSFDDSVVEFVLRSLEDEGYPLLLPPVVEPKPSGEYRLLAGIDEVAIAQRIGLFEIPVINQGREVDTKPEDADDVDLSEEEIDELQSRVADVFDE